MMTDREILDLAAKAAGKEVHWFGGALCKLEDEIFTVWNPLENDGDALWLAANLRIEILHNSPNDMLWVSAVVKNTTTHAAENFASEDERLAATRRAIVRAAAEIWKVMR